MKIYDWLTIGPEIGRGPLTRVYHCVESPGERAGVIKLVPQVASTVPANVPVALRPDSLSHWHRHVLGRAAGCLTFEGSSWLFVIQDFSEALEGPLPPKQARDFVIFSIKTMADWNSKNFRHGNLCPTNLRRNLKGGWELADAGMHSASGANFPLPDGYPQGDDFQTWLESVRKLRLCEQDPDLNAWIQEPGLTFNRLMTHLRSRPDPGWTPPAPGPRSWVDHLNVRMNKSMPTKLIAMPPSHSRFAAVCSSSGDVALVDLESGRATFLPFRVGLVENVALSDDGAWLAVAWGKKEVRLWSLAEGRCEGVFDNRVLFLGFSPGGNLVESDGDYCRVHSPRQTPSKKLYPNWRSRLTFHSNEVGRFGDAVGLFQVEEDYRAFLSSLEEKYSGLLDGQVCCAWSLTVALSRLQGLAFEVDITTPFAWSPDYWCFYGLAPGLPGKSLCRVETATGVCHVLRGSHYWVRELQIHPRTGLLVAVSEDGFSLWDRSGSALGCYRLGPDARPKSAQWSASGQELIFLHGQLAGNSEHRQALGAITLDALKAGLVSPQARLEIGEPWSFEVPEKSFLGTGANHLACFTESSFKVMRLERGGAREEWWIKSNHSVENLVLNSNGYQALASTREGVVLFNRGGGNAVPNWPGGACGLAAEGDVYAAFWPDGQVRCNFQGQEYLSSGSSRSISNTHWFERARGCEGLVLSRDGSQLIIYGEHLLQLIDTKTWKGLYQTEYPCKTTPQVAHLSSSPATLLRTLESGEICRETVTGKSVRAPFPVLWGAHPEGLYLVAQAPDGWMVLLGGVGLQPVAKIPVRSPRQVQVGPDGIALVDSQGAGWFYPVRQRFPA